MAHNKGTLLLLLVALFFTGCAATARLAPQPISTETPRLAWPPMAVTVVDARPNPVAREALIRAVERTVQAAVPADVGAGHALQVTVLRHEAAFEGGGSPWWVGQTALEAQVSSEGRVLASWGASDTHREWNTLGSGSGTAAAQASLRDALRKLLRTAPSLSPSAGAPGPPRTR